MIMIGIDFDSTIIRYDRLIYEIARERGLIPENTALEKTAIRDAIRLLPDGDIEWQKVQAVIYGRRISEASMAEGFEEFVHRCRAKGLPLNVVSHKTQYAGFDETRTDLHESARNWMQMRGFFERGGLGFARDEVYFEPTRLEKIERIKKLKCSFFIDDLIEVFEEPSFPKNITKLLYCPNNEKLTVAPDVIVCRSWSEVTPKITSR